MKKFTTTVNGYNKNEVNDFISEVIYEYENLLNRLKQKDQEITILKEKNNNSIQSAAIEEANRIIEEAKNNASKIINDSIQEAAKTEAEVLELKKKIKLYKSRLKQTINEQLMMVDDIDNIDL